MIHGAPKRRCRTPASREIGPQLAVLDHAPHVVAAQRDVIEVTLREREDLGLRFLDDADLDAPDLRQRLAAHALHQILLRCVGIRGKHQLPVMRIGLEHDTRRAPPFLQDVGPGAHRMAHDVLALGLDDLARDRHHREAGEALLQRVVGARQPYLQRVAVQRAQPRDRGVVVEMRTRLARRVDDRARADDQVCQRRVPAAAQVGIDRPLDRVDVVRRDELARLALERRVVGEQDSVAQADRPGLAVVGDHRHRGRGAGHDLRSRRQVFVFVERLEDGTRDARRVQVGALLRIEARDVVRCDPQHLVHVRGKGGCGCRCDEQQCGHRGEDA